MSESLIEHISNELIDLFLRRIEIYLNFDRYLDRNSFFDRRFHFLLCFNFKSFTVSGLEEQPRQFVRQRVQLFDGDAVAGPVVDDALFFDSLRLDWIVKVVHFRNVERGFELSKVYLVVLIFFVELLDDADATDVGLVVAPFRVEFDALVELLQDLFSDDTGQSCRRRCCTASMASASFLVSVWSTWLQPLVLSN